MYAYAKAVNKGYIDARYRAVAEKALQGLKDKLLVEKQDGTLTLTRCCQVGGLGGHPYRDGSFEYYIGEKMRIMTPKQRDRSLWDVWNWRK